MIASKASRSSLLLAILVVTLTCTPLLLVQGETTILRYETFFIEPSQPPILGEANFDLDINNEFILGIPETDAIGYQSSTRTYRLEVWSSVRTELYILDSSGFYSDYMEFVDTYTGSAPTTYSYKWVSDGYFVVEFEDSSISPKLILFSDGVDSTGRYVFSEGSSAIEYKPFYMKVTAGDRTTTDDVHIYNLNASVSLYILNDTQYENYFEYPNVEPLATEVVTSIQDVTEVNMTYQAEAGLAYHLLVWHEEFHEGVNGTIMYEYTYVRGFFEHYWSLLLVVFIIILVTLFFVFRKQTLPPTVWVAQKAKYYLIKVPWEQFKLYFSDIKDESGAIIDRMKGVSEHEELTEDCISPHNKRTVALLSLIYPVSIHRFVVGKYGTAIVSMLVQVLAILFMYTTINQLRFGNIGIAILFLLLFVVTILFYLVDVVSAFLGSFKDKDGKTIVN